MALVSVEEVWQALDEVMDPEIPVLSLVELGVVRGVELSGTEAHIVITPTFSGCPAFEVMKVDIVARLRQLGLDAVEVQTSLSPAWTTDSISEQGRAKLHSYGLVPPPRHAGDPELMINEAVRCPRCGSSQTTRTNSFGPTACREIYVCRSCREPFERFKPL